LEKGMDLFKTLGNAGISGCPGVLEHANIEGNFISSCDWTSKGPSHATAVINIDRLTCLFLLFWLAITLSNVSDYLKRTNITSFWMCDAMWLADPYKTTRHHIPQDQDIHVHSSEKKKSH
jgi:hypothetical protein